MGKASFYNIGEIYYEKSDSTIAFKAEITAHKPITVIAPKSAIKGGKKADLKLELNAQELSAGNYSRVITLITNDPAHAVVRLYIDWVVE